MATPARCDDNLYSASHDESQTQPPSSSIPPILPDDNHTSAALIRASHLGHRRSPRGTPQVLNSGPNTSQLWEPESPWPSQSEWVCPRSHPAPGPLSWLLPGHLEVAPLHCTLAMGHIFDLVNFENNVLDAEGLPPSLEQFSIELLQLLSFRREKISRLPSKTHKGHIGDLTKWINFPTRLSHHFGIGKYPKRTNVYHYIRRRGIEFLTRQFQMLQQCLIEGIESSRKMPNETSLVRKIAKRHPKYGQIAQVAALVKWCMSVDLKRVIATNDHRELVKAVLMLMQHSYRFQHAAA